MKQAKYFIALISFIFLSLIANAQNEAPVWSKQKANKWYKQYGWLCGSDFITASAVNQLEMWQAETLLS